MNLFKKSDIVLIIILLAATFALLFVFTLNTTKSNDNLFAAVYADGELFGRFPLNSDAEIEILDSSGKLTNVLVTANGQASVVFADCPDKLCQRSGKISSKTQIIACLPNRVVIEIEGETINHEVDGIVR